MHTAHYPVTPPPADGGYVPQQLFRQRSSRIDNLGQPYHYRDGSCALRDAMHIARRFISSPRALLVMAVGLVQRSVPSLGTDPDTQQWPTSVDPFSFPLSGELTLMQDAVKLAIRQKNYEVILDPYTSSDAYVTERAPRTIYVRSKVRVISMMIVNPRC